MKVFNRKRIVLFLAALLAVPALNAADNEEDKTFYFLGTMISTNLQSLSLSDAEADQVIAGLRDALAGESEDLDQAVYGPKLQAMTQERMMAAAAKEMEAGQQYIEMMAAEDGAVQTDSGLVYLEIQAGDGAQPVAASQVRAHYKGTLRDGTVFDSSYQRGEPLQIGLNQVIPCWTEGIAMMKEGGKAKLTCPSDIAYGQRAQGAIPANAALTFEVELVEVLE